MQHISASAALALFLCAGAASANGFGEARPFDFRSPSERQILLLGESTRLAFEQAGGEGSAEEGGQTGNQTLITISGNGDNTIDIGQDNTGDQTIQEGQGQATNTIGGTAPAAMLMPGSVAAAAAALEAMQ